MSHIASSRTGAEVREDLLDLAAVWRDQIARHWKLFLAIGIVMELAGFFSILAPIVTSISVAIFVGWALLIGGVIQFAHVLRREAGWERAWRLFVALITALAGLSILLFPLTGTISLTVVLVVWLFLSGGAQLGAWWQERHVEGSWTLGLSGLASVILGVLIWADLPNSAAWAIGLLVGIEFILYGMSLIMSAIAGRSLAQNTR
jgi:uncharacterized membrane protein HdeD (DUF308 family)